MEMEILNAISSPIHVINLRQPDRFVTVVQAPIRSHRQRPLSEAQAEDAAHVCTPHSHNSSLVERDRRRLGDQPVATPLFALAVALLFAVLEA